MKIYLWTDLEGVSGVVTWTQTGRDEKGEDYKKSCKRLTDEVNSAAEACFEGGADEVVVLDGHGLGFNIVYEDIHPDVKLISGPGRVDWMPGLDPSVDAVVMIGAHAMAGTRGAILDHTQNSRNWFNYWVNGVLMGEIGQTAIFAGARNIPVIFVSGDKAACDEAKALLGDLETAAVKEGLARTAGILIPPARAKALIASGVARAMRRIKEFKPYPARFPAEVKIEAQTPEQADAWERAGWLRLDGRTVRRTAARAEEILPK